MPTQKRRVIYFSDETWAEVLATAEEIGMSASAYLRTLVLGRLRGRSLGSPVQERIQGVVETPAEDSFSSRPFTPVPKPGKR